MEITTTTRLAQLSAFAIAWEHADTVLGAATVTGLTERAASNMAAYLRRRGVPLKPMPYPRGVGRNKGELTESEWDELRRIVEHAAEAREMKRRYRGAV